MINQLSNFIPALAGQMTNLDTPTEKRCVFPVDGPTPEGFPIHKTDDQLKYNFTAFRPYSTDNPDV